MKNRLMSKILSGGLAAAIAFSVFSPSVFAGRDRSLYRAIRDEKPSIEKFERVLKEHKYEEFLDYEYAPSEVSFSPLLSAIRYKCPLDILKWFFDREKTILQKPENVKYRNIIWSSVISHKNLPFLEFLFGIGAIIKEDLNRRDIIGRTLLHDAACDGWLDGVELLYKHGADVNIPDILGATPIYSAARNGHAGVVRFLVEECNADFNIASKDGYTAVSIAAGFGQLEVVKWFIESGHVTLDYRDGKGRSLLEVAKKQEWGVTPERSEKAAAVAAYLESIGAVE